MPVTVIARGWRVPPVSGMTEPIPAPTERAVVGASTISVAVDGIRPAVSTTGTCLPATGA
jgi:hypothetical protein